MYIKMLIISGIGLLLSVVVLVFLVFSSNEPINTKVIKAAEKRFEETQKANEQPAKPKRIRPNRIRSKVKRDVVLNGKTKQEDTVVPRKNPYTVFASKVGSIDRHTLRSMNSDSKRTPLMSDELREQIRNIRKHYSQGDYAYVADHAEAIFNERPNDAGTLRMSVFAHCSLGNAKQAQDYYDRIDQGGHKKALKNRCSKLGISLD